MKMVMNKTSPVPIFDDMPFDKKAYNELWRANNPNYHREWRQKQIDLYGNAFLRQEKAYQKAYYEAFTPETKKRLGLEGRERYRNMSAERREQYLVNHRATDKKRYQLKKAKAAQAKANSLTQAI
jgi:hypothetical protein